MNEQLLSEAREAVGRMWHVVAQFSDIRRADANDTIHFLHEEAGEVVKTAMKLGLIGRHAYVRSERVESTEYTYANLIMEVGDVLLMAMTLAQSFDLDPSVCLNTSLEKFYKRAGLPPSEWMCAPASRPGLYWLGRRYEALRRLPAVETLACYDWVLCTCGHALGHHAHGPCSDCPCQGFVRDDCDELLVPDLPSDRVAHAEQEAMVETEGYLDRDPCTCGHGLFWHNKGCQGGECLYTKCGCSEYVSPEDVL